MNLDTKALIGFFKEIEASRDRQKAETEFQRDVFKRAKEKHFDAKAMRIVLQRRAMDASKRDEQDYNVDCYERALEGKKAAIEALERGASTREAARAGGISNGAAAALAKGAQESSFVSTEPPHDLKTREDTDAAPRGPAPAVTTLKPGDTVTLAPELAAHFGYSPDVVLTVGDTLEFPAHLKRERVA